MINRIKMLLIIAILGICLIGCGKKGNSNAEQVSDATIGGKYVNAFNASKGSSCDEVADELLEGVSVDYELVKMEVTPGFLNGFDGEIEGFEDGVMFAPMIGSIPFVGYVFKTDNPNALLESLKSKANMRRNICTEADEMVSASRDNLVFFMMCTNED